MTGPEFADLTAPPKAERARWLITLVLLLDACVAMALVRQDGRPRPLQERPALLFAILCAAAIIDLHRREGLGGATLAQGIAWVLVYVCGLAGLFALLSLFGSNARSTEQLAVGALVIGSIGVQMLVPAAVLWARDGEEFLRCYARYASVLAIAMALLAVGAAVRYARGH